MDAMEHEDWANQCDETYHRITRYEREKYGGLWVAINGKQVVGQNAPIDGLFNGFLLGGRTQ